MGGDRERVVSKRSKEAKALQKKQFRQQVIRNKKRGQRPSVELPELRGREDISERDGREYVGLGFAGSWIGDGGSTEPSGEEYSEGSTDRSEEDDERVG